MTRSTMLEHALSSLDIRPGTVHRSQLAPTSSLRLGVDGATLVYVRSGELTGAPSPGTSCRVDGPSGDAAAATGPRTLLAGDAFLSLGCRPIALTSQSGAELTVVPAELSVADVTPLPPFVFIDGFVGLEPAAAALAAHLGAEPVGDRSGDDRICRMMVTTVVLSAIRAWASRDAHDPSWPGPAADPFLARVAAAVADDPGRDWTIDQLASLGAMSRTVFAARFRCAYGRSPAGYVAEIRMRHARTMLESGASVSETARALGYGSDEGFSRAFRRHTGTAPSLWRARVEAPSMI
ncbi:helix-turn-helix transcriptional regulator [Microbacterium marinilacus]|uniref:HTH araC/xylS-type domain-containing protein n=1 Tax=Microbacterium marinilacus TaxID=415209 RepID=A0ABP7BJB4_9MICO|nr:AraC family transcriptional regulator [Microbacterium marinilacus]MBY0689661.1 AraC family transcriptional regulator [Microbacterium marinilacus]